MSVYASSSLPNLTITFDKFRDDIENLPDEHDVFDVLFRMVGLPVNATKFLTTLPIATIKDLLGIDPSTNLKDYVLDHVSDNDGKPKFDSTLHDDVIELGNYFIENNQGYCYTFSLGELANIVTNVDMYNAIGRLVNQTDIRNTIFMYQYINSGHFIYQLSLKNRPYLYMQSSQANINPSLDYLNSKPRENNSWLTQVDIIFKWDPTNLEFIEHSNVNLNTSTQNYAGIKPNPSLLPPYQYAFWFSSMSMQLRWFGYGSTVTASDILYQPYYINEDIWNDFSTSSGDYTFDNSNVNTVTYGDITNYIDSFNQENGYPPSVGDININIENQNNDNISGGSGGGSGDGGSGDSDSGSGILGILSRLGSLIGNLIEGIGLFLTGIVEGLVNALTSLLESLSGLITGTLESLTNIFTGLIGFVYGGLPSEIQGVLLLALSVSLLITIIDLIRGR